MSFTHRMATLAAVVAIPLGIAATSYALTDEPEAPRVPPAVELGTPPARSSPGGSSPGGSSPSGGATPSDATPSRSAPSPGATPPAPPSDAVVPGPSATGDDDDDLREEG